MRSFTELRNVKNLMGWDDAQRIVNYHLMADHLLDAGLDIAEDELNKVFEWSFESTYDSENYCYNFDTVNYALICYIRDNGFSSLKAQVDDGDDSINYGFIISVVNNYCDLENDYRVIYPSEGS
jgi:hypothetical protein